MKTLGSYIATVTRDERAAHAEGWRQLEAAAAARAPVTPVPATRARVTPPVDWRRFNRRVAVLRAAALLAHAENQLRQSGAEENR